MESYLKLCAEVLSRGEKRNDRTGVGTIAYFGPQIRIDLNQGFPLLTTKKVYFKGVVHELLWFITGSTNIRPLVLANINIWNEWPYQKYRTSRAYQQETLAEFIDKIKTDPQFAAQYGELGPVYGHQWRDFDGTDQLTQLIDNLIKHPTSRRHLLIAWHPGENQQMLLPPCHVLAQFYVSNDHKLSCKLYQRSADLFLGVPFNIASYALLTHLIAQVCGYGVGEFIHTFGDAHIYLNHLEQIKLQMSRTPRKLPKLVLNPAIKTITDFKPEDIQIEGYDPYPAIKGKVAV